MISEYNGSLTREQFLFYEIRTVAALLQQGLSRDEILEKIKQENLFQFPTERMISSIANTCFKRIDALESATLVFHLAIAPADVAKQINLYAMMKYNRIVWDFMTTVIAEKYRTQEFEFSKKDLIAAKTTLTDRLSCYTQYVGLPAFMLAWAQRAEPDYERAIADGAVGLHISETADGIRWRDFPNLIPEALWQKIHYDNEREKKLADRAG